jgi:hypothetical protein
MDSARSREQRRSQGAFFTPMPLVHFLVEEALDAWFSSNPLELDPEGVPKIRVLDPAAGDGRFLVVAAQSILRRVRQATSTKASTLEAAIRRRCVIAIERDKDYARRISESLGEGAKVHCSEALLSGVVPDGSVDLVIGNPPYLRSIQLGRVDDALRNKLRGAYAATSYREWDIYAAFLEQGLRWLRADGQLAFVLPSRWWTAQWASPMRKELCRQGAVRALVDFGATQLFESATVYSSLCFASSRHAARLHLARFQDGAWETGGIGTQELGEGQPWNLSIGSTRALFKKLASQGPSLGEVARIAKGAGTNADKVFVIADASAGIEPELLRPLLRGRDVVAFAATPAWPQVLVPYGPDGKLYPPGRMASSFPAAWAHLQAQREILEARESGRFAGPNFYCFGRPQNMLFHGERRPKVVVPDVTKQGRAMIDTASAMVLDSAYAIRAREDAGYELESLCGIMNSKMVRLWLAQHGLPLRGGYTRMKSAYLRDLPLPPRGPAIDQVAAAVRSAASPGEVDELVRLAYGIKVEFWR